VENDLYENIVKNYLTETRWYEVFLLISGLLRGRVNQLFKVDHLLLAMEKEANNYLKTSLGKSKLVPILQWADEMTKDSLDSPIKSVGRRAIAYTKAYAIAISTPYTYIYATAGINYINAYKNAYSITYAYAKAGAYSIAYTDFIKQLVKFANSFAQERIFPRVNIPQLIADLEELNKRIPNDDASKKEWQGFIDQLLKTWNKIFVLTPESLNLSGKELEEIDKHYFYINRLILDCQKVAVNISPTVWQEIEDRMLRVP
jgi:hypothetical protein